MPPAARSAPLVLFLTLGVIAGACTPPASPRPLGSSPAETAAATGAAGPSGSGGGPSVTPRGSASQAPSTSPSGGVGTTVFVGAGDIASCGLDDDEATAKLLDAIDGSVFTAGDNAYDDGTAREFEGCYEPTWGRHLDRTIPAPGNHDYQTPGAAGYLAYFGAAARPAGTTWSSREVGPWHVIVLDSNCGAVGGCDAGSPQETWLRADLAASRARCTLAIWHHPRFTSGYHGNDPRSALFWSDLYDARADVIVNGHDHDYERFAPQDPAARPDPHRGIREFVAGTGGAALRPFEDAVANSEVRDSQTHGVLQLTLGPSGYDWAFVPVAGSSFSDRGGGTCH